MFAIQLLIMLILGCIAIPIALHKGRTAVGWFFFCFFLGLIPLIVLCCLSNLKEERARQERVERENYRLHEQLRQEQVKIEAFRRHSMQRLDEHDKALAMDTRQAGAVLPGVDDAATAGLLGVDPSASPAMQQLLADMNGSNGQGANSDGWYYVVRGERHGPTTLANLRSLIVARIVPPGSLVWCEGMADWAPAQQLAAFRVG